MSPSTPHRRAEVIETDLAVIGAGMAGMAAGLFAAGRGIPTVVFGRTSGLDYASGPFDLLGAHPVEPRRTWTDPWQGLAALSADLPQHPYARVPEAHIRAAFDELIPALAEAGLPYRRDEGNSEQLTSLGSIKQTYALPETMWSGVAAWEERRSCLLVDFEGYKEYSARQIAANQRTAWPGLRPERVVFPGTNQGEVSPENLARRLERADVQQAFVDILRPLLGDARVVGLPPVLGFEHSAQVHRQLEQQLGLPLFEIPTPPVSVPGLRLRHAFEQVLKVRGVRRMKQLVTAVKPRDRGFLLQVGGSGQPHQVRARAVILATGRFLGGGLVSDREGITEPLFGLPVHQPERRDQWHGPRLLASRGHPVSQAGLEIDDDLRPLGQAGRPAHERLFAAGMILAHQDWTRSRCGNGLAMATGYAAVDRVVAALGSAGEGSP
jgi:glycerol-3-phosphate dehydrogenase subunit B